MSDIKTAILDTAERRMQFGGFRGLSFREIAADVDIKSSSILCHFSTKENPADAMGDRSAKRGHAQPEEDAEDLRERAGHGV